MTVLLFCALGALIGLFVFVCLQRNDRARLKNTALLLGAALGVCLLARLTLLLMQPDLRQNLSFWEILQAFILGLRFDFAAVALTAGPFLLLLNLPRRSVRWQKCILAAGMAAVGLLALVLTGDLVYYTYVQRHTGADIWNLLTTFSMVRGIALRQYGFLLGGLILLTAGLAALGWRFAARSGAPKRGKAVWEFCCLLTLFWLLLIGVHNDFASFRPLRPYLAYENSLPQGHLTQNGAFSIIYALEPKIFYFSAKEKIPGHPALSRITPQDALKLARETLSSPQEQWADAAYPLLRLRTQFNADARGKNLVVIILESLEYRYIDFLSGTSYGATPNLDALLERSLVFDHFYASTDAASLYGVGAVLSGLPFISGLGYFSRGLEHGNFSYLGHLFSSAGYTPWFVRSAEDLFMFIGPLARLAGFASFAAEDLTPKLSPHDKPSDYEALQLLAQKLISSPKPFAAVFFSLATHDHVGSCVPKTFGGVEKKFPKDSYLRALAYTDWSVGQFIQTLKQNGLYENTVFVLTGDHRDRQSPRNSLADSFHVPLAIYAPGVLPAKRVNTIAAQADILPTLVDLFHIHAPYAALGNSLLDRHAPRFAFVSYMGGEHFGVVTQQGLSMEDEKLFPSGNEADRRRALALNRAAYDLLKINRWAKRP